MVKNDTMVLNIIIKINYFYSLPTTIVEKIEEEDKYTISTFKYTLVPNSLFCSLYIMAFKRVRVLVY